MKYLVSVQSERVELEQLRVSQDRLIGKITREEGDNTGTLETDLALVEAQIKDEERRWAPAGEPVVPWFPSTAANVFLSVTSFKQAPYARVVDDPDIDPDDLATALKKQYPGLPAKLHDEYVLAIARAAEKFPLETTFQIFVDQEKASLKVLGKDTVHVLWEQQPLPSRQVGL